jgi:hypothetical protein
MCEGSYRFLHALNNKWRCISYVNYADASAEIDDAVAIDILKDCI